MVIWSFYFLTKLYFYFRGHLQFDAMYNILLCLYWVVPAMYFKVNPEVHPTSGFKLSHSFFGIVMAVSLLWHDSYFPPVLTLVQFLADDVSRPSYEYMGSFLLGYWNTFEVFVLSLILGFCIWASRKRLQLAPAILLLLFIPPASAVYKRGPSISKIEKDFYDKNEGVKNVIKIIPAKPGSRPFDIVLIHVCSLAWDDLKQIGKEKDEFFSQFDFLFTNFNTVTTYSTPAGLRLLRSNCGQTHHRGLYDKDSANDCSIMESARKAGYSTKTIFNNVGKLATLMAEEAQKYAGSAASFPLDGLEPEAVNFDGSKLINNHEALNYWWKKRLASKTEKEFLYYNSASLHGGSHYLSDKGDWWKRNRPDIYKESVTRLFSELTRFFSTIENSGKEALIIVVPEHGAALVGNSVQANDLRDIPLPKITTVPLGFRYIQKGRKKSPTKRIDKLVSYQTISIFLNEAFANSEKKDAEWANESVLNKIPTIPFFAENEGAATAIVDNQLFYRTNENKWKDLPKELIPEKIQ